MKGKVSYQSIYANLPDDDEFITLSPLAKAVFYTLKVKLPSTGIGLMNHRVLATMVNCTVEDLSAAEAELSPKWIRRDRNLWWIINGLRHQPSLSSDDRKHRSFVRKQAGALPDSPIATAFRETYTEWFNEAQPSPSEGPSMGHGSNVESSSVASSNTPTEQSPGRPTGAGPAQILVLDRLAEPRAQVAASAFFDRVPASDNPEFWAMEVNGWLDGLNTPQGRLASPDQVRGALEEFNRKLDPVYDPPLVRGYLRRTMNGEAPRAPPRRGGGRQENPGAQMVANILGGHGD